MNENEFNQEPNEILNDIERFEEMIARNDLYYFDREKFSGIIDYYANQKDFHRAMLVLKYAKSQHPESKELMLNEVQILTGNYKYKKALRLLAQLENELPWNAEVYLTKATILSKLKLHEKAIVYLKRALDFAEHKDDIYAMLAFEYHKLCIFKWCI